MRCGECGVQSPFSARAVWALLLTLVQLAAPVWALYECDFVTITLASELVANGLSLQVIHLVKHTHGTQVAESACGAWA
jgi:hypothetical protein